MSELSRLKTMVENSADLTDEARLNAERDRDYYDGHQWTATERAILAKRKQPVITSNRIKRKIDAMVGIEQKGRVDPKAHPREPGDEDAAELATKALVFVDDAERVDVKRSHAFENLLIEGYGGVEVCVEEVRRQLDPKIKRLRWEEIFFDPFSREKDFSDATYIGVLKWMAIDKAISLLRPMWDGDEEELVSLVDVSSSNMQSGDTFEDRPRDEGSFRWSDRRAKRVRIAQMYYLQDGEWRLSYFTGNGVIYDAVSPYLDEDGKPTCAIELMSAFIDRENRRYGLVRDMISPQDEINKRRSKLLSQLNNRQTWAYEGAVDVKKTKRELSLPDGHVEVSPALAEQGITPFNIIQNQDQVVGQFNLLTESKAEIDMVGPNASLQGQVEGQQSGRAIMAQQQAGLSELAPIYDSLRDWTERVYRAIWARIKQFWTEPRWIRVTGENEAPQFIGINQMQMTELGPQMVNQVAELDVDIIITQAPDYTTLRAEQFDKLSELAAAGFPIPPKAIIMASDIHDKAEIIEAIEQAQQQAAQQQMQQAEQEAQLKAQETQGEFAKDMSGAQKNVADAQKTMIEARRLAAGYDT